jgi:ribosomal protein L37AE/L43A
MNLWVKMWPLKIFHGTLRIQCDLKERGLWYELIFLAKICRVAELFPANDVVSAEHIEKLISANETTPYPREYLAEWFGVDIDWLEQTLDKFKEQKRIREDERGIWIIKWEEHQGDYDRQKLYRERKAKTGSGKKESGPVNAPVCENCHTSDDMTLIREKGSNGRWKCQKCGAVYAHRGGSKWIKEKVQGGKR